MMMLLEESFRAVTERRAFHCVKASRSRHPVAPDLVMHLRNYALMVPGERGNQEFVAESIAASFLLDHFTPGIHGALRDLVDVT